MKRRLFIVLLLLLLITTSCNEVPKKKMPNQQLSTQAWTFPSDKTCDATQDIVNNNINTIKAQYYNLQDNGTPQLLTGECNAYTSNNVALIKQHSSQQYVTVSGHAAGMDALTSNQALMDDFTHTMLIFLQNTGFSGVELDFEDFADWTSPQYANYKSFLVNLGGTLHKQGYKLMLDGPAISDQTYQSYYPLWRWSDFDVKQNPSLANAIDYLVVLAYDYESDQGAGTPVAPLSWINGICQWMLKNISIGDHNKLVIALNSYGYHAQTGSYKNIIEDTYQESTQYPGFNTATRDASSGEMKWTTGGISYDYSDSTTLNLKLQTVLNSGISNVSAWHLGGGNPWFPQQAPQPAPSPQPTSLSVTVTQDQIKAVYDELPSDLAALIKSVVAG